MKIGDRMRIVGTKIVGTITEIKAQFPACTITIVDEKGRHFTYTNQAFVEE